jgi:PAS domain-containing protein
VKAMDTILINQQQQLLDEIVALRNEVKQLRLENKTLNLTIDKITQNSVIPPEFEEILTFTQEQFEAVLNIIPGFISWIDADLRYIGVNKYLADLYNLFPEDFIGKKIGFLGASVDFETFIKEFFNSSLEKTYQEVTAMVNGEKKLIY